MEHKQKTFKGLMVGMDVIDMPPEYTPDCCNVDTTRVGELKSISGTEKQYTSELSGVVNSIHQINNCAFALVDTILYKL